MKSHFFKIGSGPSIDEQSGTIRQVSLMEIGNAEGHFDKQGRQMIVDETTLRQVYEFCVKNGNLKVKADHGSGVMATIGWADNFALTGNKVTADFHIYETEPQRPRIIEMAKKNPDHLGMSLEFGGEDEVKGDHCLARCDSVFATALVSDPAANKSLFSVPCGTDKPEETETNTKKMEDDTTKDTPSADDRLEKLEKMFEDFKSEFAKKFADDEGGDTPDPIKDEDEKELANPDADIDSEETKKIEMAAERIADKLVKKLAANMGITTLGKPGPSGNAPKEKYFEEHVAELAVKDFSGDQTKARATILTNFAKYPEARKAYEASRLVKTA
jgi:hypothetical protein